MRKSWIRMQGPEVHRGNSDVPAHEAGDPAQSHALESCLQRARPGRVRTLRPLCPLLSGCRQVLSYHGALLEEKLFVSSLHAPAVHHFHASRPAQAPAYTRLSYHQAFTS